MTPADLRSRHVDTITTYRPAEAAKILHCSEWWLKEQARKRRVPFSWIGGSYSFTSDHIAEIVRIFEFRPDAQHLDTTSTNPTRRAAAISRTTPATQLTARKPRRAVKAEQDAART
jgi:hypothetical protein